MVFAIQASNPQATGFHESSDDSLEQAIQEVFPLYTERLIMVWNDCFIPLCYKYDLSWMMKDLLEMLNALTAEQGSHTVCWSSDTFSGEWNIIWQNGVMTIQAEWRAVAGACGYIARDALSNLQLNIEAFRCEWKRPLEIILAALQESGYSREQLEEMSLLEHTIQRIETYGILYSGSKC